jgi:AGZA family xanthine/uracil permease-like MFS transporter
MPFSYSVAYGLIAGLLTYTVLNGMIWATRVITMGHIIPADEEHKEYWTWKPAGTLPWFIRACQDPQSIFRGGGGDHEIREITQSEHSSFEEMRGVSSPIEKSPEAFNVHTDEARMPYDPRSTYDSDTGTRIY